MKLAGQYGTFGGAYVSETLVPAITELEEAFLRLTAVDGNENAREFQSNLESLLTNYAGRPTPLYHAVNLSNKYGAQIFLKREDLLHGGAHKTNNALGQGLLAKSMGKSRIIAETGAGQHGVAVAMVGALLNLRTEIYMGQIDACRQSANVSRMKLLGATVHEVKTAGRTLKAAINDALRDWITNLKTTHYILGTAAGPHPFPTMVKHFQKVIGQEAKRQFVAQKGLLPDYVVACIGGGSNAIGIFSEFLDDDTVTLIGVEPAGKGLDTGEHGAVLLKGTPGCLHGMISLLLQDGDGQVHDAHSIAAGLDYPSVGPEHAYLQSIGRAQYASATDEEALMAYRELALTEGIIPALESAHAIAYAKKLAGGQGAGKNIVINLSGRGDKDMEEVMKHG